MKVLNLQRADKQRLKQIKNILSKRDDKINTS
jgi:hypothetical protein